MCLSSVPVWGVFDTGSVCTVTDPTTKKGEVLESWQQLTEVLSQHSPVREKPYTIHHSVAIEDPHARQSTLAFEILPKILDPLCCTFQSFCRVVAHQ